jgi:hypothetical protein
MTTRDQYDTGALRKSRAGARLGLRPPSASRSRGLDEMDCRGGVPGSLDGLRAFSDQAIAGHLWRVWHVWRVLRGR